MNNKQRIMVITGASSGVGKTLALSFASKGYLICALARSADKLKKLEQEYPKNIHGFIMDVTDFDQVNHTFKDIVSRFAQIDVLINNAGLVKVGTYWEQTIKEIDQMIDVNLKGTMYCTHAALNIDMIPRKAGRIINISSLSGIRTSTRATVYQTAKHGQVAFGNSMAESLIPYNILLTTLCPGGINTPLWDKDNLKAAPSIDPEKFMSPDEISEAIEFILSRSVKILYKQMVFFPTCEFG